MAIEATQVYRRHVELFDEEALAMQSPASCARTWDGRPCPTAAESRRLNNVKGPCLIMAGSGMCTGGRILHHLLYNLPEARDRSAVRRLPVARLARARTRGREEARHASTARRSPCGPRSTPWAA